MLIEKRNELQLKLIIVFGKNKEGISKSLAYHEVLFLQSFPSVEIRYQENLHAKYYANEKHSILTSMNLYDYSLENNIEFGILTKIQDSKKESNACFCLL